MGARGRKSGAALNVVQVGAAERPPAPVDLEEREAAVWRDITASLPADWFRPSDWPILAEYCRAAAQLEMCAEGLRGQPLVVDGAKHPLLSIQDAARRSLAMLAVKLRLCPSSRMRQDATAAKGKQQPANKPWQFGKG